MTSFRDLYVFRLALGLMKMVYAETEAFPRHELYGLTSQMRRASVGVLSNIAEGEGRLTVGEWRHMLSEARGSLFEVEAQAIAANVLGYLPDERRQKLERQIRRLGKALLGLIRYVQEKERANRLPRNPVTPQPRDALFSSAPFSPCPPETPPGHRRALPPPPGSPPACAGW
jgi:four helix bundle protein